MNIIDKHISITPTLINQIRTIMNGRYVGPGKRNPNATLTEVRDLFMRQYPSWWERASCALWVGGLKLDRRAFMIRLSIPDNPLDTMPEAMLEEALENIDKIGSAIEQHDIKAQQHNRKFKQWIDNQEREYINGGNSEHTFENVDDFDLDNWEYDESWDEQSLDDELDKEVKDKMQMNANLYTDHDPDSGIVGDLKDPAKYDYLFASHPIPVSTSGSQLMMAAIQQAIRTHAMTKYRFDQEDGDLDQDRLVEAGAGTSERVFLEEMQGKGWKSTVCQIFVDISGSMDADINYDQASGGKATRLTVARDLAVCIGRILDQVNIRYEVILFEDMSVCAKAFDIHNIDASWVPRLHCTSGGTYLGRALAKSFPVLMEQPADRRVAFIITDGDIGGARDVLEKKEFKDIETCAFGLGHEAKLEDMDDQGNMIPALFTHSIPALEDDVFNRIAQKMALVLLGVNEEEEAQ